MGFFDKIFGSKKGNTPEPEKKQEAKNEPETKEEVKTPTPEPEAQEAIKTEEQKPQETSQTEQPEAPKTETQQQTATEEPTGAKVDMSKFRVALNDQKPPVNTQEQNGEQTMTLNLNLNLGEVEISDERCNELLQQTTKGPEGVRLFASNTVRENLFVCCHLQQVMLPKAAEKKDEQHFRIFQNLIQMYGRLLTAKAKRLPCLYGVFLNSTHSPLGMGNGAVMLMSDTNVEKFKEEMKSFNFDVEIIKVDASRLLEYAKMLKRSGFEAISLSDGLRLGFMFPVDLVYMDEKEQPKRETYINPRLQFSMLSFMQEVRRRVDYNKLPPEQQENAKRMVAGMEAQMFHEIARAEFVLPLRKDDKGMDVNPVFDSQDGKEHLLAVYTDLGEMQKAFPGWVMTTTPYSKLCAQVKRMGASGFLINNAGICVPVTQPVIERIDMQKEAEEKAEAEAKAKAQEQQNAALGDSAE